jgi:hypothetical protein
MKLLRYVMLRASDVYVVSFCSNIIQINKANDNKNIGPHDLFSLQASHRE